MARTKNQIQKDIDKLQCSFDFTRENLQQANREHEINLNLMQPLQKELAAVTRDIKVSDHAVIRYLERAHNFDFEKVRSKILDDEARGMIHFGCTSIKKFNGKFIVKNDTIITYIANKG